MSYRFEAIASSNSEQIINNYKKAFVALSCAQMFLTNSGQDAYMFFKQLNEIISNDKDIEKKQEVVDKKLSGQVFMDMTPEDKSALCNETYK